MAIADTKPVQNVRQALQATGIAEVVIELEEPAENPAALARMVNSDVGAVVVPRIYAIGKQMVLVMTAGDHAVIEENLGPALFLQGDVRTATDAEVRGLTGYTADCLPPAGWRHAVPAVLDRSLKRFEILYALAGDLQCALAISMDDLKRLTGAIVSWNVAQPIEGEADIPAMGRHKTFTGERDIPSADGE